MIRLSVYPYIRKYLLHHYSEPFFVTERGYIPSFLESSLEPMPKLDPATIPKTKKILYGEFFSFCLSEYTVKTKGCYLSSKKVKRINEVISDLIHEEMYRMITQATGRFQVDQTIRDFQRIYDFSEDELPFDNLKRWYYRERENIQARRAARPAVEAKVILTLSEEKQAFDCVVKKIAS